MNSPRLPPRHDALCGIYTLGAMMNPMPHFPQLEQHSPARDKEASSPHNHPRNLLLLLPGKAHETEKPSAFGNRVFLNDVRHGNLSFFPKWHFLPFLTPAAAGGDKPHTRLPTPPRLITRVLFSPEDIHHRTGEKPAPEAH